LDALYKIYKRNRKQKKRKGRKKKKYTKGPRGIESAQTGNRPVAQEALIPKGYPPSLFLSLTHGTHPSARLVFKLQPEISQRPFPPRSKLPPLISL
jgi:hypothetical protein